MEETKMGACPKNKVSKLRGRTRRAHIKVAPVSLRECPSCHTLMQAHKVCANCGDYKGVHIVDVKSKEKEN